jgi:hypothetical protein
MIDEVKYLVDVFKEYGFWGFAAVAIVLFLISAIKSEWIKKIYTTLADKFVEKFMKDKTKDTKLVLANQITEADITSHEIFNYINLWKFSMVPTINFSTEYRTVVFRKYLSIYLECYKSDLKSFLQTDYKSMGASEIKGAFLDLINKIIYDYERLMVDAGIPKIIIEKMKVRNNDTINLTIDLIEGICGSNFYDSDNNYLKVYSILNIILSVLDNTISNSESTCNSINGQLAGLSFSENGRVVTEPGKKH